MVAPLFISMIIETKIIYPLKFLLNNLDPTLLNIQLLIVPIPMRPHSVFFSRGFRRRIVKRLPTLCTCFRLYPLLVNRSSRILLKVVGPDFPRLFQNNLLRMIRLQLILLITQSRIPGICKPRLPRHHFLWLLVLNLVRVMRKIFFVLTGNIRVALLLNSLLAVLLHMPTLSVIRLFFMLLIAVFLFISTLSEVDGSRRFGVV